MRKPSVWHWFAFAFFAATALTGCIFGDVEDPRTDRDRAAVWALACVCLLLYAGKLFVQSLLHDDSGEEQPERTS